MTHNYLRLAAVIHLYVRRPQTAAKRPEAVAMTKQMSTAANLLASWGTVWFSAPRIAANTKKTVNIGNIKVNIPNRADKTA